MGSGYQSGIPKASDPLGLRTLSQEQPHFKPKYFGDLEPEMQPIIREQSGHGYRAIIDAWLKLHPNQQQKAGDSLKALILSSVDAA
jgi:glycogen debranching enzyme